MKQHCAGLDPYDFLLDQEVVVRQSQIALDQTEAYAKKLSEELKVSRGVVSDMIVDFIIEIVAF